MRRALQMPLGGWQALQPAIYLISAIPVLWWFCARAPSAAAPWLVVAGLGVVLLQHAVNVFNDANDWRRGADSEKWNSWVRYHEFNTAKARWHATISLAAGMALGIAALLATHKVWVLAVASPWVALGLLYNLGPYPFAYSRWGELVTGLCYGSVFACLWLVVPSPSAMTAVWGSLGCGCLAVAVLLAHQPPQILSDAAAGKKTHAVLYGVYSTYERARWLFRAALFFAVLTLFTAHPPAGLAVAASLAATTLAFTPRVKNSPRDYLLATSFFLFSYLVIRTVEGMF